MALTAPKEAKEDRWQKEKQPADIEREKQAYDRLQQLPEYEDLDFQATSTSVSMRKLSAFDSVSMRFFATCFLEFLFITIIIIYFFMFILVSLAYLLFCSRLVAPRKTLRS